MAEETKDKLVTTRHIFQTKKVGMGARLETAKETEQKPINPDDFPNRLGMVFDDSSSMSGEPIKLAHQAVETFIKNCSNKDTCLAIYPLNAKVQPLSNDFAQVGLYTMGIGATGGTPLYTTLNKLLQEQKITRAIAFSDGDPTDGLYQWYDEVAADSKCTHESVIAEYSAKKVPIDTVFIGDSPSAEKIMKDLAQRTGGTYLHFTKPEDMAKNLKYLAPRYRALLANAEIKAKVERGESI